MAYPCTTNSKRKLKTQLHKVNFKNIFFFLYPAYILWMNSRNSERMPREWEQRRDNKNQFVSLLFHILVQHKSIYVNLSPLWRHLVAISRSFKWKTLNNGWIINFLDWCNVWVLFCCPHNSERIKKRFSLMYFLIHLHAT